MAATRTVLLKFAPGLDLGIVALIVTLVAATTPLLFFAAVKGTAFRFLFKRPARAKLAPAHAPIPEPEFAASPPCLIAAE